jgi:filamentous hemagglutinin family protein
MKNLIANKIIFILTQVIYISVVNLRTNAQIIPDNTLGRDNSTATQAGSNTNIGGGLLKGNFQFHSFKDFNIDSNQSATLNSPININNILIRVTGNNASNILGRLNSIGNQDIFFLNPNGIFFGKNTRIDTNGSFFATTARGFIFSDGSVFNSNGTSKFSSDFNPKSFTLIFDNPGSIVINNMGHNLREYTFANPFPENTNPGFGLANNQTLGIIGGDVYFNGGIISSDSSNIYVGSIKSGKVDFIFNDVWKPSFGSANLFGNINLTSKSLITTTESGSINFIANQINLFDGSGISHFTDATNNPGSIIITAFDSLNLLTTSPDGFWRSTISSQALNNSKAADIKINVGNLKVLDGSIIGNKAFGNSTGGVIEVSANDSINVVGFDPLLPFSNQFSAIASITLGYGNSGNLLIRANYLNLYSGGDIGSATFGPGNSGDVEIRANKATTVIGFAPGSFVPSTINAASFGNGDAGDVNLYTGSLFVGFGGRVGTSALGAGNAGNLYVKASDSITLIGLQDERIRTSLESAVLIDPILQSLYPLPEIPTGKAGNVSVIAPVISLDKGASINLRNDGQADSGNLRIIADEVLLKDSTISAITGGGNGGNTEIDTGILFLRNSQINSSASFQGNGGSTTVTAKAIVGDYTSSIRANAVQGFGGRIKFTTQTLIFPLSNITATSDRGIDFSGKIDISAANYGPQQKITLKPDTINRLSTTTCNPSSNKTSFILSADDLPDELNDLGESDSTANTLPYYIDNNTGQKKPVVDMQGLVKKNGKGIPIAVNPAAFGGSYQDSICRNLANFHEQ